MKHLAIRLAACLAILWAGVASGEESSPSALKHRIESLERTVKKLEYAVERLEEREKARRLEELKAGARRTNTDGQGLSRTSRVGAGSLKGTVAAPSTVKKAPDVRYTYRPVLSSKEAGEQLKPMSLMKSDFDIAETEAIYGRGKRTHKWTKTLEGREQVGYKYQVREGTMYVTFERDLGVFPARWEVYMYWLGK